MQTSLLSATRNDPEKDLERIRFVTRNFNDLRGFRTLWTGLAVLMYGLSNGDARYGDYLHDLSLKSHGVMRHSGLIPPNWLLDWVFYISALADLVLVYGFIPVMFIMKNYYRERFGIVTQKRAHVTFLPLLLLTAVISDLLRFQQGANNYAQFGLAWIVMGLYRPQLDRLALGVSLLAIATFQPFLPPLVGNRDISLIVCGTACAIVGLLDHRQLVAVLGHAEVPSAELESAETVEGGQ